MEGSAISNEHCSDKVALRIDLGRRAPVAIPRPAAPPGTPKPGGIRVSGATHKAARLQAPTEVARRHHRLKLHRSGCQRAG